MGYVPKSHEPGVLTASGVSVAQWRLQEFPWRSGVFRSWNGRTDGLFITTRIYSNPKSFVNNHQKGPVLGRMPFIFFPRIMPGVVRVSLFIPDLSALYIFPQDYARGSKSISVHTRFICPLLFFPWVMSE